MQSNPKGAHRTAIVLEVTLFNRMPFLSAHVSQCGYSYYSYCILWDCNFYLFKNFIVVTSNMAILQFNSFKKF